MTDEATAHAHTDWITVENAYPQLYYALTRAPSQTSLVTEILSILWGSFGSFIRNEGLPEGVNYDPAQFRDFIVRGWHDRLWSMAAGMRATEIRPNPATDRFPDPLPNFR